MDLRDLRTFVTVAELGSFTAAAGALGYTQSAVSQQVAALEAEVGRRLLERRPVRPTAAGARLAEHAQRILLRLDLARSEMAALEVDPNQVRAAFGPLSPPDVLVAAAQSFHQDHPTVGLDLAVRPAADAIRDLAAGRIDVAVIDGITAPDYPLPQVDPGLLVALALREVPLVVAFPAGHPLARRRRIGLEVLGDAPWIEAPLLGGPPFPAGSLAPLRVDPDRAGRLRYEGVDVAVLLAMVAAGLGLAILPGWMEGAAPTWREAAGVAGVVGVELSDPGLVHRCEVVTRRRPTTRAEQLAGALRRAAS